MNKLTKAMIKDYVNAGGVKCPYCGSNYIGSTSPLEANDGIVTQLVTCPDCGELWTDIYKLNTIKKF